MRKWARSGCLRALTARCCCCRQDRDLYILESDDSMTGACGIRLLLLPLLLTDPRSHSGGRHRLAGRFSRRWPCFFANTKVVIGCSSVGWAAGVSLSLKLLLLRAALILAFEMVAATAAASEHLSSLNLRTVWLATSITERTLGWSD